MANPILKTTNFANETVIDEKPMTITGTINKSLMLISTIILSACYVWSLISAGFTDKATILGMGGFFAALIAGLVVIFAKPRFSNILAFVYSIGEGFCLGYISAHFEARFPGIVMQAFFATLIAMLTMLLLYRAGMIRATEKFRSVMFTAMSSILIIYVIQIGASFFGRSIPQIFEASTIGIIFSFIVVAIASLNFILDFDNIEQGATHMAPKIYEWICALGLMFSLVWLYIELLNLLAKLSNRN